MKQFDLAELPSLKQLVYDKLQQLIIHGELMPGMRLTEEELSQSMNISRAPIREALNMLDRDGFVRIVPRKGAIVAEASVKDSMDIWKCRLALEPFAAREACGHIPEEKLKTALEHVADLERQYEFEKYIASDLEVHELFYTHLDNSYMRSILNNLKAHSVRVRWLQEREHPGIETAMISVGEHRIILEAFIRNDPDAVFAAVQKHIHNAMRRMFPEASV